jgi:hypothetical protein
MRAKRAITEDLKKFNVPVLVMQSAIPYALDTDWPVGAAGFERLHLHLKVVGLRTLLAKVSGDQRCETSAADLIPRCGGSNSAT